jgi:GNAT superfamily N-acetyltransferase
MSTERPTIPSTERPRPGHEPAKRVKLEGSGHNCPAAANAEDECPCHEPAKRVELEGSGHDDGPAAADAEDEWEEGEEYEDGEMSPEELLEFEFSDAMKNVVHEPQHGNYAPPARASSGCAYAVHNRAARPLPQTGVVAGTLRLTDVHGSRLDYAVSLEVGLMLPNEFYDCKTGNGFVRFAQVMDMYETVVPPACRGQGHAKRLVRAAFAVAFAHNFLVRPSCSYISETFLAAHRAEEFDARLGRRCEELLLFTCCPEGKALEGRRRELAKLSVAALRARCQQVGANISGAKYLMVERLLGREFGAAAAHRFHAFAGQERCRVRAGLGCGGCRACRGEGGAGWVSDSDGVRRRRDDEQPDAIPPHERCVLFPDGPESAEWGPPAYMHADMVRHAHAHGAKDYTRGRCDPEA